MTNIIDVHSHYIPQQVAQNTAFFKVGWSDLDRQLGIMDQNRIEKSVLLYPTSDAHLNMGGWSKLSKIYNESIATIVKKYPDRFIGAGILPPDSVEEGLKCLMDSNLRVISLASSYEGIYLDDEKFFAVYEFAARHHFPIHVHPQIMNPIGNERLNDPLLTPVLSYVFDVSVCLGKMMMAGIFDQFPNVNFIFAHYGGVLPIIKERFDNTYQMLRKRNFVKDLGRNPSEFFKNIYFDTSGSKSSASLLCALEVADAGHILFGSDFPANQNLVNSINVVTGSTIDAKAKNKILGENFLELINS
ncbi:MAG: amidohydrolase family protein [Candidatus Omnitrophica bacterium]|nr:amidohydrolase family protein [Candidatus Omnitrophota bacterium]